MEKSHNPEGLLEDVALPWASKDENWEASGESEKGRGTAWAPAGQWRKRMLAGSESSLIDACFDTKRIWEKSGSERQYFFKWKVKTQNGK